MSNCDDDKPMILGPIEEFKQPSTQRMSEHSETKDYMGATAYTPTQCATCLCHYPSLYMVGDVCRFCDMTQY